MAANTQAAYWLMGQNRCHICNPNITNDHPTQKESVKSIKASLPAPIRRNRPKPIETMAMNKKAHTKRITVISAIMMFNCFAANFIGGLI